MNLTQLLFVYGTLKRGYSNHKRLLHDSEFVGRAVSCRNYKMFTVGFPCLLDCTRTEPGAPVTGEIFEVSLKTLAQCDHLEGHPDMYCRQKRKFELLDRVGFRDAWVYLYQHPGRFTSLSTKNMQIRPTNGLLTWNVVREAEVHQEEA